MSECATAQISTDLASGAPVSRAPMPWLRKRLTQGERKWVTVLRNQLQANGYGDRRTCEYRARRSLFYRRMAEHELDAIAAFGAADYERAWAFLEDTARLASKRPEDLPAPARDPLA